MRATRFRTRIAIDGMQSLDLAPFAGRVVEIIVLADDEASQSPTREHDGVRSGAGTAPLVEESGLLVAAARSSLSAEDFDVHRVYDERFDPA